MARRSSVLLVDPNLDSREMYSEFLRHAGLEVLACGNAADALPHAANVDVVVTGIALQGQSDGVELVERLRSIVATNSLPIVVLTACTMPHDRQRAEAAGCDAFLPKPCLPDHLLSEVRRLLASRRVRKPRAAQADLSRKRADSGKKSS